MCLSGIHTWRYHDGVTEWKHFSRYWPFVRGIHRSPVNSPHKGQWRGALMFCLICAWINGWVNNREAGDLRRHRAHYDVIVMINFEGLPAEQANRLQGNSQVWSGGRGEPDYKQGMVNSRLTIQTLSVTSKNSAFTSHLEWSPVWRPWFILSIARTHMYRNCLRIDEMFSSWKLVTSMVALQ